MAKVQNALAGFNAFSQYGDGMNPYGFVGNNPITGHDPSGLFTNIGLAARGAIGGTLMGVADLSIRGFALGEDLTAEQIILTLARNATIGFGATFALGKLAGGLARYSGIEAIDAAAAVGIMFGVPVGGAIAAEGVRELQNASDFGESLAAIYDIGAGASLAIAPHLVLSKGIRFQVLLMRAKQKLPRHFLSKPARNGKGRIFYDPNNPNNTHVRIDPGKPGSEFSSNRRDHVHVTIGGTTYERGGNIARGLRIDPDRHISFDEWMRYRSWDKP